MGYSGADFTQHGLEVVTGRSKVDVRTPFQHDVDRILYASEFRSLAGKTQVVASDQIGNYHNRLTHSLKVAQIGKRLAVLLGEHAREDDLADVGPDADLVEAACLIHDIGHPPFGHIGEIQMAAGLDALWIPPKDPQGPNAEERQSNLHPDGFQANAQNLRIATYLAVRKDRGAPGLHLTRALLDSATKYPWHRGGGAVSSKAWGCYRSEDPALAWVLSDGDCPASIPPPPDQKSEAPQRPVEEQIMDWADEVTYACHDVEDFYRAGLIPLADVLSGLPTIARDPRRGAAHVVGYETTRFLTYLKGHWREGYDEEAILGALRRVANTLGEVFPYEDTQALRGSVTTATGKLLGYFLGKEMADEVGSGEKRKVRLEPTGDSRVLTRYAARLHVEPDIRQTCDVLNQLIKCYVINRPSLASQQQGQRRILRDLIDWYANDPKRLLPEARAEEFTDHDDALRAAADAVSSLTETEAVRIHRRMSGIDYGQITDLR